MARKLQVEIVGDASSLSRAFKTAGDSGNRFGSAVGKVGKIAGLAIGGGALGGLALTLKAGVTEWDQNRRVTAQTAAVIKSTGGVANVTAKHVDKLSSSLLAKTGIDDEQIASGQDMLLTFTDIRNEVGKGNDIFDQAAKASLDLSVAMGTDMKQSALQLGKALNDPARGMTRLQRIGVAFTDAQKEQVKAMVASGDTMGAQKVILAELNKEFGGSAEAIGKTMPARIQILREQFNNLAGTLVQNLMPTFEGLLTWVTAHMPQISAVMSAVFNAIGYAVTNVVAPALRFMIDKGTEVVAWFKANWPEISATFHSVIDPLVAWFKANWPQIALTVTNVANTVRAVITGLVTWARAFWDQFGATIVAVTKAKFAEVKAEFQGAMNVIRGIVNIIGGLLHGDWSRVWEGLKQVFTGIVTSIKGILTAELHIMVAIVSGIVGAMLAAATRLGSALLNGVRDGVARLVAFLRGVGSDALNVIKALPRQFYQAALNIGSQIMQGILDGIRDLPGRLKDKVVGSITGAFGAAGSFLSGSGAFMFTIHKVGKPLAQGIIDGFIIGIGPLSRTILAAVDGAVGQGKASLETGLADLLGSVRGWAADLLTSMVEAVRQAQAAAYWQQVHGAPGLNGGGGFQWNVPGLATGGVVAQTGLAVVHKGEDWSGVGSSRRWGAGSGGGDIHIHIGTVIGTSLAAAAEEIRRELLRTKGRNGTLGLA